MSDQFKIRRGRVPGETKVHDTQNRLVATFMAGAFSKVAPWRLIRWNYPGERLPVDEPERVSLPPAGCGCELSN
jgi:hypothetical protein